MSDVTQKASPSPVLFWEVILEKELLKALTLLEEKKRTINYLRSLPFDHQNEKNFKIIKKLEADLSVFLGVVATIEKLKIAYVDFTASVADQLIQLNAERDFYRQRLIDYVTEGGVLPV